MQETEPDFSFKNFFVPLTAIKAFRILVIVGLVVYFYIFFNGFVWDDITYIVKNPELHRFNLATLIGPNTFNSSGYFRPIPAIYFSLLYNLFGETAFFYHLFQLVLHLASASLLFLIYRHFFKPGLALILSLVFVVHPINVESVAYIGASQSQLYFLFGGTALYLCLEGVFTTRKIIFTHLLLTAAMFTKEVSLLFYFVIYLYLWLFKKHIPRGFYLASFISLIGYFVVRISILGTVLHRMQMIPISEIPLFQRLIHVPVVFIYYLKTFIFPKTLAINQIWTISTVDWNNFYLPFFLSLFFITALLLVLYKFYRSRAQVTQAYLFFLLWFVSGMSFLLQIFPLDMTVADRWFYIPIVGLLGILGLWVTHLKIGRNQLWPAVVVLVLLSVRTMFRTTDWYNPLTLYGRDAGKFANYDLENNLGAELAFSGKYAEALPHFLKSIELWPHDTNLYNAGSTYEYLKDYPNAIKYHQQALEIQNDFPSHSQVRKLATLGLAKMLLLHGQSETVNQFLKQATQNYPDDGTLWGYLAINEYSLNHYETAFSAASKAKDLLPNETTDKLYQIILNRRVLNLQLD